jgi:hypothetical protein
LPESVSEQYHYKNLFINVTVHENGYDPALSGVTKEVLLFTPDLGTTG